MSDALEAVLAELRAQRALVEQLQGELARVRDYLGLAEAGRERRHEWIGRQAEREAEERRRVAELVAAETDEEREERRAALAAARARLFPGMPDPVEEARRAAERVRRSADEAVIAARRDLFARLAASPAPRSAG